MKFYKCNVCGNVMVLYEDSGVVPVCCGQVMEETKASGDDASKKEKHVPQFDVDDNKITIQVGDVLHPMSEEHYIKWIALETDKGFYVKYLIPNHDPIACFYLCEKEKPLVAYSYCNIHGLWMNEYEK